MQHSNLLSTHGTNDRSQNVAPFLNNALHNPVPQNNQHNGHHHHHHHHHHIRHHHLPGRHSHHNSHGSSGTGSLVNQPRLSNPPPPQTRLSNPPPPPPQTTTSYPTQNRPVPLPVTSRPQTQAPTTIPSSTVMTSNQDKPSNSSNLNTNVQENDEIEPGALVTQIQSNNEQAPTSNDILSYSVVNATQPIVANGTVINPLYVHREINPKEEESKEETSPKAQNLSLQPLTNCRPSLVAMQKSFTNENALEDAKTLRTSLAVIGCDENKICEITSSRTHSQRLMIKAEYAKVDTSPTKERSLIRDFDLELRTPFKETVMLLFAEPGAASAFWMKQALDGRGYNLPLLLELLCTRTNEELNHMKDAWPKMVAGSLTKRMSEETSKIFSANHFQTFCLKILEANRPINELIDDKLVMADAQRLSNVLSKEKKGDAKTIFVELFTQKSWRYIAAVVNKFEQVSKNYTLKTVIIQEWADSDTSQGLQTILEFVTSPYDFWANKLYEALTNRERDNNTLIRVIISRCEIDLANIIATFDEKYGKTKKFKNWIMNEITGSHQKVLLKLCGY